MFTSIHCQNLSDVSFKEMLIVEITETTLAGISMGFKASSRSSIVLIELITLLMSCKESTVLLVSLCIFYHDHNLYIDMVQMIEK